MIYTFTYIKIHTQEGKKMTTKSLLSIAIITTILSQPILALPQNTQTNTSEISTITGPYTTTKTHATTEIATATITGVSHIKNVNSVTLKSGTKFDKNATAIIEAKEIKLQSGVTFEKGSEVQLKSK